MLQYLWKYTIVRFDIYINITFTVSEHIKCIVARYFLTIF